MKIAVIGATGMLGRPVTEQLIEAGHDVTVLARDTDKARRMFPGGATVVRADVFDGDSLREGLRGHEGVYVSLQISPAEGPNDRHAETDGLRNVVDAAKDAGVGRLSLLSSLVKSYQGMNGFHWWAFEVKQKAIEIIRTSEMTYTVFYPSSFMENMTHGQRQGNRIMTAGRSHQPMWFIAGEDYGRQVAVDFAIDDGESRDWPVQGPEAYNADAAAERFVSNWEGEPLKISNFPLSLLKLFGLFSRSYSNVAKIVEAINEYPEQFESDETWKVLGRPQVTLPEFAKSASKADAS